MFDKEELLYEALCIALEAGEIILGFYTNSTYTLKEDKSPLTDADLQSNKHITQRLESCSPYRVCSEEAVLSYEVRKDLEYYWLIDPLDGTKDFLAKNGNFTINIALIHKQKVVMGVVYAPCFYEAYIALQGFGSYSYKIEDFKHACLANMITKKWLCENKVALNGDNVVQIYGKQRAFVLEDLGLCYRNEKVGFMRNCDASFMPLIACDSIFHSTQECQDFIKKYDLALLKRGSSLKICSLASGLADIYPRLNGTSEWDTAASDIILSESGGIMVDCKTQLPLLYNKKDIRNNHFIGFTRKQLQGRIYCDYALS